jgi:hypothetical protein
VNETAIHLSGMPKHFADEIIKNAANVVWSIPIRHLIPSLVARHR